jgi:hypothetical protein
LFLICSITFLHCNVVISGIEVICHAFQTLPVENLFMLGPDPTLFPVFATAR